MKQSLRHGALTRLDRTAYHFFCWMFRSRRRVDVCHSLIYFLYRVLFGLKEEGSEWIPRDGGAIVAFNHGSHYDGSFMLLALYRIRGHPYPLPVYWSGILDMPIAGAFVRALGGFPISHLPEDNDSRMEASKQIVDALSEGALVQISPEGRRNDRLGDFNDGMALFSLISGCPIVPCSLCGIQPLYKELPFPNRFWGRVRFVFHRPIEPAPFLRVGSLEDAKRLLTKEVRKVIASAIDYPDAHGQ